MTDKLAEFNSLFNPQSIAVIGASKSFSKTGTAILFSIIAGGYKGNLYPINRKETSILGLTAYPDLFSTPSKADLVIICVRAEFVQAIIAECAKAAIGFVSIISSGFGEISLKGKKEEEKIIKIARKNNMRLIGPNCMGLTSSEASLHALMNMLIPKAGDVSIISQSGTVGSLIACYGSEQGIGISRFISSGNEADLHAEDFIEYLAVDPKTKVITAFIEGIKNGKRFLSVTKEAARLKPVIILKGGTTMAGARAAGSHTGSIAGSAEIFESAISQAGMIRALDEKDLIDLAKAFSLLALPKGKNVGITGAWGGTGVLVSDACSKNGLQVPDLTKESLEKLDKVLPPFWSRSNPVDITGAGLDGDFFMLIRAIEVLLEDDNIDMLICVLPAFDSLYSKVKLRMDPELSDQLNKTAYGSMGPQEMEMAKQIVGLRKKYNKPIVGILVGLHGQKGAEHISFLEENSIPIYETSSQAARVLAKLSNYSDFLVNNQ